MVWQVRKRKKGNHSILYSCKCKESIPSLAVLYIFITTTKKVKQNGIYKAKCSSRNPQKHRLIVRDPQNSLKIWGPKDTNLSILYCLVLHFLSLGYHKAYYFLPFHYDRAVYAKKILEKFRSMFWFPSKL